MTPEQAIKRHILISESFGNLNELAEHNIDEVYDEVMECAENEDILYDAMSEFREEQEETNIDSEYNRHYESKSVASKLMDGSWVGWTYWYGGGKHRKPESIDWIDDAYYLNVKDEQKIMTVRTFVKENIES